MAQYLISVDYDEEITNALNGLMLERGANTISPGEWILETDSEDSICLYQGIAALVGSHSVIVKELDHEASWDDLVVSQDLFFELLKQG